MDTASILQMIASKYKKQGLPDIFRIIDYWLLFRTYKLHFYLFHKIRGRKSLLCAGARINIFIGGTMSKEFSNVTAPYCEQNLRYRYTLSFFCSNEAIDTLGKNSFEALRTKLKSEKSS